LDLGVFENGVVGVSAGEEVGTNRGSLCVRGRFGYDYVNHPDRLTVPLIRKNGALQEASWDEALSLVAAMLNRVILNSGPEAVGGLISPRSTNEEAYLFQKFIRRVVGTRNVDSTGRFSLDPFRMALKEITGLDFLSAHLDAVAEADAILVVGGDLDRDNHIIAANKIRQALWTEDAHLVVVHAQKGRLADEADCWLRVRPGDEITVLNGMTHLVLEAGARAWGTDIDAVEGFEDLKDVVSEYTPERVEASTGVSADLLREAAGYLGTARRPAVVCSPPLGQQPEGVQQMTAVLNLALLSGALTQGSGVHLVGPQSNMMGVVEMGGTPSLMPGYEPIDGKGLSAMEMFEAAVEGRLKALFCVGENPFVTLPKTLVDEGTKALDLLVVHDMYPSAFTERADVVLPARSFAERNGTYTNCEGKVQRVRAAVTPQRGLRWLGEILTGVASFMGREMKVPTEAEVFREIVQGNRWYKGMDFEQPGIRGQNGSEGFTKSAAFRPVATRAQERSDEFPFYLSISGLLYNYLIGSGKEIRGRGLAQVYQAPALDIHTEAAHRANLSDGDVVRLTSPWGAVEVAVHCTEDIHPDALVLHLTHYGVDAAQLLGQSIDRVSLVPNYGMIPAKVEKR
jgi:predicted molibdopterin-dependent oxidoreductase YjgC